MLIDFFLHLRDRRLPVSTTEYLSLLEALSAGLANYRLDDFYSLSRICLVKSEANYDKFDLAFSEYFQNVGARGNFEQDDMTEDWLRSAASHLLSAEDLAMLEISASDIPQVEVATPNNEKNDPNDNDTQKGSGGNNPFGQGGVNPEGIRLEGLNLGNRRAVKPWDSRQFQGLDDGVELGTRNIKMALRRLRKFAREGAEDELDLDSTIASTARNAGWLDLKMRPERRNKVKVLILFDTGGSMGPHVKQCEDLFSAAKTEFKQLEYFYFHNCIADSVWRYDGAHTQTHYPIHYLLHKFSKDYKLIIVGDASMAPVEILEAVTWQHQVSAESGEVLLRRLLEHYKRAVWLNPEPERYWHNTQSIQILRDIMDDRMYPMTIAGLDQAMKVLSK